MLESEEVKDMKCNTRISKDQPRTCVSLSAGH